MYSRISSHLQILPLLLSFLVSCSDLGEETLSVRTTSEGLDLYNTTSETTYYTVFTRESLVACLWKPCDDPLTCPAVLPGSLAHVLYKDIWLYTERAELVVYWWHLVQVGQDKYSPVEIRTVLVGPPD